MRPLIGITTGEIRNLMRPWGPITYGQDHAYSDAILRAGGVPLLIPLTEDIEALKQLYDRLDGIVMSGGNDIDPTLYGETYHVKTVDVSVLRDSVEEKLLTWALKDNLPILAICRGAQLLNVVCSGTLYQDIPSQVQNATDHEISTHKEDVAYIDHKLKIEDGSLLAKIIQHKSIGANSRHHQAVKELGKGLRISAHSEDGIVEAIELPKKKFVIGIQCHPESLHDAEPRWDKLFDSFVEHARHV